MLGSRGSDATVFPEPLTAEILLYTAMQQTLPANHEGMLSLVNGKVRWTAPEVVGAQAGRRSTIRQLGRQQRLTHRGHHSVGDHVATTYRAVSVPVTLEAEATPAHLIFAYDYQTEKRALNQGFLVYLLVGLVVLLIAGVTGWMLVGRVPAPDRPIAGHRTPNLRNGPYPTHRGMSGGTTWPNSTITVNAMLDRLENAMTSQRQLLDDVGHELRTPVTIIRGTWNSWIRWTRRTSTESRDIALSELDRMSFLINDLVTLAKSNRIDFVQPVATQRRCAPG